MYYLLYYLPEITFFITGWLVLDLLGSGLFRLLVRPLARRLWGEAQSAEQAAENEGELMPEIWQQYLRRAIGTTKEITPHVRLKMKGVVRSKANGPWHPAECRVFFTTQALSMVWYADITRAFMVSVKASEQYHKGKAFSTRWVLSTFPFRWVLARVDEELAQRNAFFSLAGAVWRPQWWKHYVLALEKIEENTLCLCYSRAGVKLYVKATLNSNRELEEWSLWNENWQEWQAGVRFSDYQDVHDQQMPLRVEVLRKAPKTGKYVQADLEITDVVQKGDYAWW